MRGFSAKPPPPSRNANGTQQAIPVSPKRRQTFAVPYAAPPAEGRRKNPTSDLAGQIAVSVRLLVATVVGACSSDPRDTGQKMNLWESKAQRRGCQEFGLRRLWPPKPRENSRFVDFQTTSPLENQHICPQQPRPNPQPARTSSRQTTTQLTNTASTQLERNAAQRLRSTMGTVRPAFTWLGVRKTLAPEQRTTAARAFHADRELLSASKLILDTKNPVGRARRSRAAACLVRSTGQREVRDV